MKTSFDQALGLDECDSYAVDMRKGLLFLDDRVVPIVRVDEMWTRDVTRPAIDINLGYVPVVVDGGA